MARGDPKHLETGNLDKVDRQTLQAMLAHMEQMSNRIKKMLNAFSTSRSTPPASGSGLASNDVILDNIRDSQCPASIPDCVTPEPQPIASKKDLPSPAATDDVPSSAPAEDKTASTESVKLAAESEVEDTGFQAVGGDKPVAESVAMNLHGDGKTGIEEQAIDPFGEEAVDADKNATNLD
jgi:hypothetical protein